MNIVLEEREEQEVGRDRVNLIKFRDVSWCRPATKDDPARCHSDQAAGLTTAVYVDDDRSERDGAIVDADIELNGVNFAISAEGQTTSPAACKAELQNTLTHELGHLLGLEHPCRVVGDPPRVDHKGNAVPMCSAAGGNSMITEATMYNFQDCGERKKASIEADDINAICTIYPLAEDPGTCDHVGETRRVLQRLGAGPAARARARRAGVRRADPAPAPPDPPACRSRLVSRKGLDGGSGPL